ncbi:LysR family transcriptional regulator [Candidatus Poriferisodalis sp.]|uniref:LysR family transcriptional regulator n=1 Tax=Candidatus Poriferisodalis sp. TaxID=3101277 RepID=UPI003B516C56
MDLKYLDALSAVAAHGRFSAAARALHTVQSNVSSHIAKLEEELGAVLVDRAVGSLTPEGEVVLARIKRINGEIASMRADVASMTSHVTGDVHLGIIGTPGRWLLPPFLDELRRRHPDVDATVVDSTTLALTRLLEGGELDLAVVNAPVDHEELVTTPLFTEEFVVIAPTGHALAALGDREVGFVELEQHEMLLGPPGSAMRMLIDSVAARHGVTLRTLAQLDGIRLTATLAFQGYGPAIVPITSIPVWTDRGDWSVLTVAGLPPRQVALAIRRRGMLSAPAAAARDVLRSVMRSVSRRIPGVTAA